MSSKREPAGGVPDAQAGRAGATAGPLPERPRRLWLAAAILLAFTLAVFGDVLFATGERVVSESHRDICLQYAAWRDFGFSQLRRGNFALWNPHIYSGAPFFGGAQTGLLYPLNYPYLFLPLARAINVGVALHVFLGGLFMYLWASRRGLRFLARLFCGVLWMFCGQHYYHIMAGHLNGLISTAWIPLLFLSLDGFFEDEKIPDCGLRIADSNQTGNISNPPSALCNPQLKWILLGSLTIAMMALGGDAQYLFHVGVAAAIYSALCCAAAAKRRRILTGLAAMCAIGAAIAAVQILSGIETTAESLRGGHGVPYDFARAFWLPPENFLTLLAPGFFGPEAWLAPFRYWGRWFLWEMCLFIGVTGLLLAIYGAIAGERAKRRFSLAMVLALLVLALGAWLPPVVTGLFPSLIGAVLLLRFWRAAADKPRLRLFIRTALVLLLSAVLAVWWFTPLFDVRLFRLLYDWAPGFNRFRGMSKFAVPASAFLVLLSGIGLDRLLRADKVNARLAAAPLLLAALLIGLGAGMAASAGPTEPASWWWRIMRVVRDTPEIHMVSSLYDDASFARQAQIHAGESLLWAGVPCTIAGICLLFLKSPRKLGLCLALLGMGEMFLFAWSLRTSFDLSKSAFGLKDFFQSRPGDFRVLLQLLQPTEGNFVMTAGGDDIWGYGPLVPARYGRFIWFTQGRDPDAAEPSLLFRLYSPIYKMLRCGYSALPAMKAEVHDDVLPHVALVRDYLLLTKRDDIFAELIDERFDPGRSVILESRPDPAPAPSARQDYAAGILLEPKQVMEWIKRTGASGNYAAVVESGTDYLVIEAETDQPAVLLVTDDYSAGWRVRPLENGPQSRYEVMPANYCLRAVPLQAGHHKIVMEYAPKGYRIGWWISIVAAAGWLAALGWLLARRARRY
jgi:hypothetical protein